MTTNAIKTDRFPESSESTPVIVTGVRLPFFDLMWLLVKITLASIPATLILIVLGLAVVMVLAAIGAWPAGTR
jgi:hypothetical protein